MLMSGADLRRDRSEPRGKIFDVVMAEVDFQAVAEPLPADEPGSGKMKSRYPKMRFGVSSRAQCSRLSRWLAA